MVSAGIIYGDYFLLGRLNAGGMAEVFLGKSRDPSRNERLLAVKRMLPQLSKDPNFASMFGDEARIARKLHHPNICEIVDEGQHEKQVYIVMEFIHGKDLKVVQHRARQRGEPIPYRVVAFVLAKIAEALDYAHVRTNAEGEPEKIVHRDVSPQNILISYDGIPKLIDFGIAKATNRLASTRVGVVKGKFAYMSPEQATGGDVDGRTDIFALGVVMYELLCGELPFRGSSDISTLKRIARGDYRPVMLAKPDVPKRLADILSRALTRDPAHRYQRAADMAEDFNRYLNEGRRDVSDTVLSAYMRKLFRDDYIREMARIRAYELARVPTPQELAALPRPEPVETEETTQGDRSGDTVDTTDQQMPVTQPELAAAKGTGVSQVRTVVAPALFLAAGYDSDAPPEPVEPEPLDDDAGELGAEAEEIVTFEEISEGPTTMAPKGPVRQLPPIAAEGFADRTVVSPIPDAALEMVRAARKKAALESANESTESKSGPWTDAGDGEPRRGVKPLLFEGESTRERAPPAALVAATVPERDRVNAESHLRRIASVAALDDRAEEVSDAEVRPLDARADHDAPDAGFDPGTDGALAVGGDEDDDDRFGTSRPASMEPESSRPHVVVLNRERAAVRRFAGLSVRELGWLLIAAILGAATVGGSYWHASQVPLTHEDAGRPATKALKARAQR